MEQQAAEGAYWGLVPAPVIDVVQILARKAGHDVDHLKKMIWPDKPRDVQDLLRMSVSDAHKIARAGGDLRALITAYAHRFHEPRPVMADLARAQDSTPQGIPRRYGDMTVQGLRELLSDSPNTAVILKAFRSLSLDDLTTVRGRVGEIAAQQKSGELEFVSYAVQERRAREEEMERRKLAVRDILPPRTPNQGE